MIFKKNRIRAFQCTEPPNRSAHLNVMVEWNVLDSTTGSLVSDVRHQNDTKPSLNHDNSLANIGCPSQRSIPNRGKHDNTANRKAQSSETTAAKAIETHLHRQLLELHKMHPYQNDGVIN